jgi:hypothetical protein
VSVRHTYCDISAEVLDNIMEALTFTERHGNPPRLQQQRADPGPQQNASAYAWTATAKRCSISGRWSIRRSDGLRFEPCDHPGAAGDDSGTDRLYR